VIIDYFWIPVFTGMTNQGNHMGLPLRFGCLLGLRSTFQISNFRLTAWAPMAQAKAHPIGRIYKKTEGGSRRSPYKQCAEYWANVKFLDCCSGFV
jgi:hypothetical protein